MDGGNENLEWQDALHLFSTRLHQAGQIRRGHRGQLGWRLCKSKWGSGMAPFAPSFDYPQKIDRSGLARVRLLLWPSVENLCDHVGCHRTVTCAGRNGGGPTPWLTSPVTNGVLFALVYL